MLSCLPEVRPYPIRHLYTFYQVMAVEIEVSSPQLSRTVFQPRILSNAFISGSIGVEGNRRLAYTLA